MAERDGPRPPSSRSRDVAGEDFLFHLYRGSELLQDNRVHDAKAELEHALALQPSDPKGQDLLGIVYFRLGLYPRAIAIYERLIQMHPDETGPRINLALSYLKTGQPANARVELEKVVEQNPGHSRAWGYLGLALQRLGDYERASYAFGAGGHDAMARRLSDLTSAAGVSLRPEPPAPARA
jgi:Tfp pilus assembly protein PilF